MFKRKILESPKGRAATTFVEKLSPRDLSAFLLDLMDARSSQITPFAVLQNYEDNRFCPVSPVSQKTLHRLDHLIYCLLPCVFDCVELSPVTPMGLNCSLSSVSPKIVLQTIRSLEINANPTTALAIECARRKRVSPKIRELHLATSHRSLRLQVFDETSGFTPHFRTFCLASSGRNIGRGNFVGEMLARHLKFWLDCLAQTEELELYPSKIKVAISDISIMERLTAEGFVKREDLFRRTQDVNFHPFDEFGIDLPETISSVKTIEGEQFGIGRGLKRLRLLDEKAIAPLRSAYLEIEFSFDLARCAGIGYYNGLCIKITAQNREGKRYPLIDGGASNWTKKLLNNQREQFFVSGMGTELFARFF